ncbi:MAG: response regulator transcription factor [Coprobacillaceae bacterium]
MRVLMVEDEKYIAKAVGEVLRKNHYTVDLVYDGITGLDYAMSDIYDILILDIMLPGMDGYHIVEELRKHQIATPIILLTARGEISDKVRGLDLGADDYLAKPFHSAELLARMRAIGRRKEQIVDNNCISFGDFILYPHTLMLHKNNKQIKLTLKEAQVLEYLIHNKNHIISKDKIIEKIWGYDSHEEDNHVESHVSLVRKKMKQLNIFISITTVRGAGYTLIEKKEVDNNV